MTHDSMEARDEILARLRRALPHTPVRVLQPGQKPRHEAGRTGVADV